MSTSFLRSQLVRYWATSVAASVLLLVLAAPLLAQNQGQNQGDNRLFNEYGGPLSDFERQRRLDRDMEQRGQLRDGSSYKTRGVAGYWYVRDIQKGTAKLQATNGKLQQAIQPSVTPDYKRIAGYASKIRTLAGLLQNRLPLPKAARKDQQLENESGPADQQLRASIQALDRLVSVVVTNEVIQRPGVFDAQLLAKAGRDLIELRQHSARVKTLSNELRRK